LAICRAIGDRAGEGITLNNLSRDLPARWGSRDGAALSERSRWPSTGPSATGPGEGTVLNNLSQIYRCAWGYETARRYCLEGITGHPPGHRRPGGDYVRTLFNMGHIYFQKNEHQQALAYWVAAYRIAKEIGYAEALMKLGKSGETTWMATVWNIGNRCRNKWKSGE
jgi:tetratricopeptide (TPR) repeat protein